MTASSSRSSKRSPGFTLLELLVALAVFAIMASAAYSGLRNVLFTRAAIEEWAQPEADMNRAFGDEMPGEAVEQTILADCDCDDTIANGAEDSEEEGLFELPRDVKEMHIGRIMERIEDKTKALKEYTLCRENWLYVFSETTGLERSDLLRIQSFFNAQEDTLRFDKVLIKVGCQLYVLVRGEELSEITLRSRTLLAMHRKARRLSIRDSKCK